jgi:hypothetical protein
VSDLEPVSLLMAPDFERTSALAKGGAALCSTEAVLLEPLLAA